MIHSNLPFPECLAIIGLFAFGFFNIIAGIGSAIGSLFSKKKSSKAIDSSSTVSVTQFNNFKKEVTAQMDLQSQENKKLMTTVVFAMAGLLLFLVIFMRK